MLNVELGKELLSLKKRIAELEAKLDASTQPEKPFGRKAELGSKHWMVTSDSQMYETVRVLDSDDLEAENLNVWFRTKEEAEFWLEEQKLRRDIREFVGHDPDDLDETRYYPLYEVASGEINWNSFEMHVPAGLYIGSSKEQVERVIRTFGDRIKKYIFKVED